MIIIVFTNNSQHDLYIVGAFLCYEYSDELKTRLVTVLLFFKSILSNLYKLCSLCFVDPDRPRGKPFYFC